MTAETPLLRVIAGGRAPIAEETVSVPPHDLELEANVVANAVINDAEVRDGLAALLTPESFYSEAHRRVFEAVLALREAGKPVDGVAVAYHLRETGRLEQVGGMIFLTELTGQMPVWTRANVIEHARRVRDLHVRRRARDVGLGLRMHAELGVRDNAIVTVIERARADLEELAEALTAGEVRGRVEQIADRVVADVTSNGAAGKGVVPTGFPSIDRLVSGLPIDLAILAGMPGEAKTSLATAIAVNVARAGAGGVLIASLETTREELFTRMAAAEARASMQRAVAHELGASELTRFLTAVGALRRLPVFIEHEPMAPRDIYARARAVQLALGAEKLRLRLVVVDYLQLVRAPTRRLNRSEEIADITRALKAIAVDLGCPVLALSQLNESKVDGRQGNAARPKVGDLFGSSELRKCARLILGLHRPDAHATGRDYRPTGRAEIEVLKNNKGPTGGIAELLFDGPSASFSDGSIGASTGAAATYTCGGCGARLEAGMSCACGATTTPAPLAVHTASCRCRACDREVDDDDRSLMPPGY